MSTDDKLMKEFTETEDEIRRLLLQMRGALLQSNVKSALAIVGDVQNIVGDLEQTLEDADAH